MIHKNFENFPIFQIHEKDVLKYMLFRVKIIPQIDFTSLPHTFYTGGTSTEVDVT